MPWGTRRLVNEDFHTGIVCESCSLLLLPVDHTAVPSSCGDAAWSTRPHPVINLTSNKDVALSHQFMLPTQFCLINFPECLCSVNHWAKGISAVISASPPLKGCKSLEAGQGCPGWAIFISRNLLFYFIVTRTHLIMYPQQMFKCTTNNFWLIGTMLNSRSSCLTETMSID